MESSRLVDINRKRPEDPRWSQRRTVGGGASVSKVTKSLQHSCSFSESSGYVGNQCDHGGRGRPVSVPSMPSVPTSCRVMAIRRYWWPPTDQAKRQPTAQVPGRQHWKLEQNQPSHPHPSPTTTMSADDTLEKIHPPKCRATICRQWNWSSQWFWIKHILSLRPPFPPKLSGSQLKGEV